MEKMELGSLSHALRTEMSQVVHWALFLATAAIAVWVQVDQTGASYLADLI